VRIVIRKGWRGLTRRVRIGRVGLEDVVRRLALGLITSSSMIPMASLSNRQLARRRQVNYTGKVSSNRVIPTNKNAKNLTTSTDIYAKTKN